MKKQSILLIVAVGLSVSACTNSNETTAKLKDNPFMKESTLPYSVPDFTKIKNEHFKPAFIEGMKQQTDAINQITSNNESPTFDNTVLAIEKSSALLDRVSRTFSALTGAHTNDELQETQTFLAPLLSAHSDAIYLNDVLFQRLKTLYNKKDELQLDSESLKLLENYYENFEIAGANLSDVDKEKLKEINSRLATLSTEFNKTLLAANNAGAVIITDNTELAGLSESEITAMKTKDEDSWKISLLNTTQQPLLQSLENRATREKLFNAAWKRADGTDNDTKSLIIELAELRAQKGKLLGFANYAEWSMQKTMAKVPETVFSLFEGLVSAGTAKAQVESDDIQKMIKEQGQDFTVEPWDWTFYAEKVRKARFDLDEEQIKPYFELTSVLENGVFYAATQLYGITFKKRNDIPVYHEDVVVYEVFEQDGTALGLFYGDFFARESKRGGAWMSNFVGQSKLYNTKPVIYNVSNYPKPIDGEPALLTFDNVITTFHEFGHALHGFFADQMYPSLSGTSVARDFVEFPSQFNENWALYPEILKNYAKHYKTGEQIPQELINKIKNAGTFNQGYALTENLAASNLDMQWHTIAPDLKIDDANKFEKDALHKTKLDVVHAVPPRYRSTYFSHIFGSGYAAGYYSYLWTDMLNHDAYNWFENNGGLTRANGQRFRDMILSRGNTLDYETMYKSWRGSDPKIEPLLKAKGLK